MKSTGINEISDHSSMIPQTKNIILRSLRKTGQMADEYLIGIGGAKIGGDQTNDIVLPFVSIDEFHATIEYENNRFILKDLKSENGTFINGRTIDTHSLQNGLLVAFGDIPFFCEDKPDKKKDNSDKDTEVEQVIVVPKSEEKPFEKVDDTKPIFERIVCPVCEETFRIGEWICWSCGYDPIAEEQRHDAKMAESVLIQPSPKINQPLSPPREIVFEEEENLSQDEDLSDDFFRLPPELIDKPVRTKHSAAVYIIAVSFVLFLIFAVVVLILFPELLN